MIDRIRKALIGHPNSGSLFHADAIEYQGKLWLVPSWLEVPAEQLSKPARIVRFDNKPHQVVSPPSGFGDYVLNVPVPTPLLGDRTPMPEVEGWEYVELPEIEVPSSVRPLQTTPDRSLN